jgi:hypothetical protein
VTISSSTGMTFVQAAEVLAAHLVNHKLPEPALQAVMTIGGCSQLRVQLRSHTVAEIAAELLMWAQTLSTVTVQIWRVPEGDRVQLSITSTMTGPAGRVELDVYGGCAYDPILIADLSAGDKRIVSLEELRSWATNTAGTTGEGGAA